MLIGLNGKLKSGKDTVFQIIKELHPEAERVSYADKFKAWAAAALGTDVETLEYFKNREDIRFPALWSRSNDKYSIPSFNIRQYEQRFGTDGGREIFGENIWVDAALPEDTDHFGRLIVVTDMRFPNEIERVIELAGFTVRVNRDGIGTAHGDHASENDVEDHLIDYELDNNKTDKELRENIKRMLKEFKKC